MLLVNVGVNKKCDFDEYSVAIIHERMANVIIR